MAEQFIVSYTLLNVVLISVISFLILCNLDLLFKRFCYYHLGTSKHGKISCTYVEFKFYHKRYLSCKFLI